MKLIHLFILFAILFSVQTVFADCNVTSTLRVGSKGAEVECLQQKVGVITDGKFGPLTRAAVMVFQSSNRLVADGIVGPLSRLVLNGLIGVMENGGNYPAGCTGTVGYSPTTGAKCDGSSISIVNNNNTVDTGNISNIQPPIVLSVFPDKVRSGDTVKIYGENFSPVGNTVRLRYAQIEDRFENLPSNDGKVISFMFQPPEVETMSEEELLSLPSTILNKILDPMKAAGGSIDDIVTPYRNIKNENDLRRLLNNNGHSFDELYDKFYVTIENVNGRGSSSGPILAGLRKLSFGSNLSILNNKIFPPIIRSFLEVFTPKKVYAQIPEGGTNSGVIFYCTCGPGYMTTMVDFSTNSGSGLYWWSPGFVPNVGNPMIAGPQLGFYTKNAGQCSMNSGPSCYTITANIANLPWGEAP